MKRNRNHINYFRVLLMGAFLCIGLMARSQDANLAVVCNPVGGAPADMKFSELKAIMMGEKQRWKSGKKITIALIKTNRPIGQNTCKKIYQMTGDEVNKFWLALVFQGKAQAPVFFNSTEELLTFVAQNEGAIGILNDVAATNDVKPVLIEGKKTF